MLGRLIMRGNMFFHMITDIVPSVTGGTNAGGYIPYCARPHTSTCYMIILISHLRSPHAGMNYVHALEAPGRIFMSCCGIRVDGIRAIATNLALLSTGSLGGVLKAKRLGDSG